eukprot:s53_g31.t1
MDLPGPTLIQNIKRRQEAEGGLVKRRVLSGGTVVRTVECDGATSAAAAAAAAKATAALKAAAPALPGVTPRRRPSGQARDPEAQQVIERTPPNRVTTPLRVYTRKSQRRSVSEDRGSVVSVRSRPSPPRSDSEATPSPKILRTSEQAKSRKSLAEERLPATPQRRSLCITGHRKEAEEAPASAAPAAAAAAPASPVASPAPASPTSVQRSRVRESCSICCEDVSEGSAVRLSCSHGWYCFQCLKRHAEARLEMGSVDVCCPQCNAQIAERTLRQVLPGKLVERLLKRSLEQAVSSVGDLYACPTPNCTFRVALEEGDIPRLKCPQCKKTCCLLCGRQPYHRGRTCQEAAAAQKTRRDSGEAALKRWMEDTGSKQCPTCHAIVTKQNLDKQGTQYVECHKMMCRNCDTKFCFKCLKLLSKQVVCNCSRHEHGFINPKTGRRLNHVEPKAKAKAKTRNR